MIPYWLSRPCRSRLLNTKTNQQAATNARMGAKRLSTGQARLAGALARCHWLQERFHRGGQIGAQVIEQPSTIALGKLQRARGGIYEPPRGLVRITEQAVAQRQGGHGQRQSIDQGVPSAGLAAFDRAQVALHD